MVKPHCSASTQRQQRCRAGRASRSALAACVVLAGCANDSQRTTTEGALVGAAILGVLGHAVGGRDGALVGATLGAAAGAAYGDQVANQKAALAQREDTLQASIDRAHAAVALLQSNNKQIEQRIAALDQSLRAIQATRATVEVKRKQLLAHQQSTRETAEQIDQQLAQVRNEIGAQQTSLKTEVQRAKETKQAVPESKLRLMTVAINDLQDQQSRLERARQQLLLLDRRRAY